MSPSQPSENVVHLRERLTRLELRSDFDRTMAARELQTTKASLERELELVRFELVELQTSIRDLSAALRERSAPASPPSTDTLIKFGLAALMMFAALLATGDPNTAAKSGVSVLSNGR